MKSERGTGVEEHVLSTTAVLKRPTLNLEYEEHLEGHMGPIKDRLAKSKNSGWRRPRW